MSRQFDIFKLAEDVLASVAEPVSEKVAAASDEAVSAKTEIGLLLKNAAAALRSVNPSEVTYEDISETLKVAAAHAVKSAQSTSSSSMSSTGPAGSPATAAPAMFPMTQPLSQGAPGPAPNNPLGQGKFGSDNGSAVGRELRVLAAALREKSAAADTSRATKAAHVITAAVGLEHLAQTFTR